MFLLRKLIFFSLMLAVPGIKAQVSSGKFPVSDSDPGQTNSVEGSMAPCSGTANASSTTPCTGSTVNLSLSGTSFGVNSYQWQSNVNGGGWGNIGGATSSTYTTGALTSGNTYQYRCVMSGGIFCSSGNSTTVTVTPAATPTTSDAGTDQTVCATTATLAGNNPANGTGTWTLVSGSGSITSPGANNSGLTGLGSGANTFRWTISNGDCTSSTDDVIITNDNVSGGTASANACQSTAILSLSGEYGTSLQWQQNINGGGME